jgi:hypothetical protein
MGLIPQNILATLWGLGMKRSGRCLWLRIIPGFFLLGTLSRKEGQSNGRKPSLVEFPGL